VAFAGEILSVGLAEKLDLDPESGTIVPALLYRL